MSTSANSNMNIDKKETKDEESIEQVRKNKINTLT